MSLSIASSTTGPAAVDFSAAAAAANSVSKLKTSHPDAAIIQACINFAIAMRGASGAFEADPTGDNDFAQAADGRLLRQASKEHGIITESRATTLDGLRAKAVIVNMALDLDRDSASGFARSLAADVIRFHRAATEPTNRKVAS